MGYSCLKTVECFQLRSIYGDPFELVMQMSRPILSYFLSVRNIEPKESEEEEPPAKLGPNLSRLWSYECPATKGLSVNCMVWNKANHVRN